MRRWLLDRLVMDPSSDAIDPESRIREVLPTSCGDVELWKDLHVNGEVSDDQSPELLMIKFPELEAEQREPLHARTILVDSQNRTWASPGYERQGTCLSASHRTDGRSDSGSSGIEIHPESDSCGEQPR